MERISIFNYEAFYLDYLEGNLSEKDTRMLLQFLEEHPECRLEEEELVVLDDVEPMTFSGKKDLKQVDEKGAIGLDNVEHFMIADAEGLLTDEKKAELNAIVAENQELEATRNRYKAVYFVPDESVIFAGKSDLKQRKALVIWPYLAGTAAAAAVVLLLFMTNFNSGTTGETIKPGGELAKTGTSNGKKPVLKQDAGETNPTPIVVDNESSQSKPRIAKSITNGETLDKAITSLTKMERRFSEGLAPSKVLGDVAPRPINANNSMAEINPEFGPIPSAGPKNESMENPIEPITAFISEKAKKEVEFKRRKASEKEKGGFFLKIGKFELSKNKH